MSALAPAPRLDAPAALAAFLRGVERRGAVLAELQCGDADAGDAALASAMRGFRTTAAGLPMADWPRAFWAGLLAQPQMQHRTPLAMVLDATDNLADLGNGPRAALLLRLAAGLTEAEAATVLGVAQPTYRLALRRALPSHADGSADAEAWQRLREQIHRRIKTLPLARLDRLTGAREAALRGQAATPTAATSQATPGKRPRALLALLWALLALCAGALAATFWWSGPTFDRWMGAKGDMQVRRRALPPADAPASRYGREAGLIAHRDFAMLTDPLAEANSRDLDFYSWMAAQQTTAAAIDASLPAPTPINGAAAEQAGNAASETHDAPR